MTRVKFNTDDWTGNVSFVNFNVENGKFTLDEYEDEKFQLVPQSIEDDEIIYDIILDKKNKIGEVFYNFKKEEAEAYGSGIERRHKGTNSQFIAAAKLIMSIL